MQDIKAPRKELTAYENSYTGSWTAGLTKTLINPDIVLEKDNKDISVLYELQYDTRIQSCIFKRTNALKSYEVGITADISKRKLNALKSYMKDTINVDDIIDNDSDTYCFGYKIYEIVMEIVNGMQCPILKPRMPDLFQFDKNDNLFFLSKAHPDGELMPKSKFIIKRIKAADDNPYGESTLSRCYWFYIFKRIALKYWAQGTEEYAKPRPFAEYPLSWSEAEVKNFGDTILDFAKRGLVLVPEGTGLRYDSMQALFQPDFFLDLITYCDDQISEVFLGQSLTMNNASTGTYGGRKVGESAELLFIKSDKKRVDSILNTIANLFLEWNYGLGGSARISLGDPNDIKADIADRDTVLVNQGLKFTKEYYSEMYNLSHESFELEMAIKPDAENVEDVLQSLNLNGTQIASATKIIERVASGMIPRDSGVNQLQVFLGLTKEQAEAVMGAAESSGTLNTAKSSPDETDKQKEYLNPETSEEELNGDNT